jgi:hypothetical protein
MAHQSWVAGYVDGYLAGLEEAWARVNAQIEIGPLPRDRDQRPKSLLRAAEGKQISASFRRERIERLMQPHQRPRVAMAISPKRAF